MFISDNFPVNSTPPIPQPTTRLDPFEELRRAQMRYHEACHQFLRADQERITAKECLEKITIEVQALIQAALQDPTAPQQGAGPTNHTNGRH
jgi:hypothetical protein